MVPSRRMLMAEMMEIGEKREFPVDDEYSPDRTNDMVRFHTASDALR